MPSRRITAILIILALSLLPTGAALAEDTHWSYDGDTGPAYWGVLSPDWALCGSGQSQTPIDVPSSAPTNPADLEHHYDPSALTIFNNGHTIQVNYDLGSDLVLDGQTYELAQFHFHADSEHTVDGGASPMELHLVHKNAQGDLAVVGVFLEQGAENAAFASIFANMPVSESEPEAVPGVTVDADDLLPTTATYWRYNGSLTTPGCAEGVKWLVMNTPVTVSAEQIATYTAIYDHNSRPVQPMNDREFIVGQQPETLPVTGDGMSSPLATVIVAAGVLIALAGTTSISVYRRRAISR